MKVVIILGLVVFTIHTVSSINLNKVIEKEWSSFKIQYNKSYEDVKEEAFRKKVYLDNKLRIARHNKLYESGEETYTMAINQFGDLTQHEFNIMYIHSPSLDFNDSNFTNDEAGTFLKPENVDIPESIDWRMGGYVTPVKSQGQCGSCWAFSSTGSLEGQIFRKTGVLVSLSEQNLIDCTRAYGNYGCNGGWMTKAFMYIEDNGGLDTEDYYPYEGVEKRCRYNPNYSGATDYGFENIPFGSEDELQYALATIGPVSVIIDASKKGFQFYKNGVMYDSSCDSIYTNHAVLVVGYGSYERLGDYWIVKNSWDTTWGDKGYILMARNRNNNCGIASYASYPLV